MTRDGGKGHYNENSSSVIICIVTDIAALDYMAVYLIPHVESGNPILGANTPYLINAP